MQVPPCMYVFFILCAISLGVWRRPDGRCWPSLVLRTMSKALYHHSSTWPEADCRLVSISLHLAGPFNWRGGRSGHLLLLSAKARGGLLLLIVELPYCIYLSSNKFLHNSLSFPPRHSALSAGLWIRIRIDPQSYSLLDPD